MDDAKILFALMLLFTCIWTPRAFTVELEYIGPEKQHALEKDFDRAGFSPATDSQRLTGRAWRCDMFGVRSHMQVQRDLPLYKWSQDAHLNSEWHNAGVQMVSEYKNDGNVLIGTHDRFEDQVKLTARGQLISRLSVVSKESSGTKMVVAYSVCNGL